MGDACIALPTETVMPEGIAFSGRHMAKRRTVMIKPAAPGAVQIARLRLSEIDKKIRKTSVKAAQVFKSKKAYDRAKRKREDRKLERNHGY